MYVHTYIDTEPSTLTQQTDNCFYFRLSENKQVLIINSSNEVAKHA